MTLSTNVFVSAITATKRIGLAHASLLRSRSLLFQLACQFDFVLASNSAPIFGGKAPSRWLASGANMEEGASASLLPISFLRNIQKAKADRFITSLMEAEYDDVEGTSGMKVMRGLYDLETGQPDVNVIVRNITVKFWKSCIEKVDTPGQRYRVAAVGTRGIGKTYSTAVLIRLLLEEGRTVVYHVRTKGKHGWLFEFSGRAGGGPYSARVYPENILRECISSLRLDSTYYVVDPGGTKQSCSPPSAFRPKVIIVTSPDSRNWGQNNFTKARNLVQGFFKFYPVWSLDELVDAQPIIRPDMNKDEVLRRFRLCGGIPRHVFNYDERFLRDQNRAINGISEKDVERIILGEAVGMFDSTDLNTIMGYELAPDDGETFENEVAVILAAHAKEKLYTKFIDHFGPSC
jgi:hypothetical protein